MHQSRVFKEAIDLEKVIARLHIHGNVCVCVLALTNIDCEESATCCEAIKITKGQFQCWSCNMCDVMLTFADFYQQKLIQLFSKLDCVI